LGFGGFGVVPKFGRLRADFFFFYLYGFLVDVKDTSSTPESVPTNL
jgi:hypothetical protein